MRRLAAREKRSIEHSHVHGQQKIAAAACRKTL